MFKIEEDFDTTLDIITIILENEDVMLNNTFKRKEANYLHNCLK